MNLKTSRALNGSGSRKRHGWRASHSSRHSSEEEGSGIYIDECGLRHLCLPCREVLDVAMAPVVLIWRPASLADNIMYNDMYSTCVLCIFARLFETLPFNMYATLVLLGLRPGPK